MWYAQCTLLAWSVFVTEQTCWVHANVIRTQSDTASRNEPEPGTHQGREKRGIVADMAYKKDIEDWRWCFCGTKSWLKKLEEVDVNKTAVCASMQEQELDDSENLDSLTNFGIASRYVNYQCLFKELNLVNADETLNTNLTRELFTNEVFVEDGIQETASLVMDRCFSTNQYDMVTHCTFVRTPLAYLLCILTEIQWECPPKLKNNEDFCKALYDVNIKRVLTLWN